MSILMHGDNFMKNHYIIDTSAVDPVLPEVWDCPECDQNDSHDIPLPPDHCNGWWFLICESPHLL